MYCEVIVYLLCLYMCAHHSFFFFQNIQQAACMHRFVQCGPFALGYDSCMCATCRELNV